MINTEERNREVTTFSCNSCGADLTFNPGTTELKCQHCGATNDIPVMDIPIEELDFNEHLKNLENEEEQLTVNLIKCKNCGASSTLESKIQSASCPYCATPLIVKDAREEKILRPKSLLPFKLNKNEARGQFEKWVKGLWFAPNALQKAKLLLDKFKGIYLPFWTYDSNTDTPYLGQRGEHYYVTESYTTTENGKSVTRTRQVQRTRWYTVSGRVQNEFDDVLIPASYSLPEKYVRKLEPWDLNHLKPFEESFLSGFISEKYQRNLQEGFSEAKQVMEEKIRVSIRRDIGGDEQRITSMYPKYSDITFKHILLPVYVCAYTFKEKLYQFIVNARTGEVQGDRPWSWVKITFASLAAALVIAAIVYFSNQ